MATAFSFLQTTDLVNIKPGKHLIDGDNVYAIVTEGPTRKKIQLNGNLIAVI